MSDRPVDPPAPRPIRTAQEASELVLRMDRQARERAAARILEQMAESERRHDIATTVAIAAICLGLIGVVTVVLMNL